MGILKSAILPFNAAANSGFFASVLLEDWVAVRAAWGTAPINLMERHLWDCLGAMTLCNTINNIVAIRAGNPLYQMMVCAMQILFGTIDVWSWIKFGVTPIGPTYLLMGMVLMNLVGLLVHLGEQGVYGRWMGGIARDAVKKPAF